MSTTNFTNLPVWTAAGWTMVHLLWVGAVIGLFAASARWLLRSTSPEIRYGVALLGLLALSISPVLIFVRLYDPMDASHLATIRTAERVGKRWIVYKPG